MPPESSDLLTLPGAAKRLGIHRVTALRMAESGRFPGDAAVKVGRKWLVSVPKLDRYLHGERVAS
jgi:excisionase family DNA binding protein